jgi:hypothetical protein
MTRIKLFIAAVLLVTALAAVGGQAFADGGPLPLCPPKSTTCKCTVFSCK